MKTFLRLLGALFAVALVAAACGGSTATETAEAPAADVTDSDVTADDDAMADDDHGDDHADDDHADDDHGDDHSDDHGDDHGAATLDVDPDAPIPDVAIEVTETDTPGLFDVDVTLTNFTITPDNVDGDPIANEGHMHLLVDGVKLGRFFDTEYQVTVPDGEHLVEVEINANDHSAYSIDGVPIRAGQTVTGSGDVTAMGDGEEIVEGDDHDHDHAEASSGIEAGLTADDATISIAATLADGTIEVDGDEDRVEAAVGDIVMVMITSDVAEEAHLHGYDILVDVEPGTPAMMLFTADTPGKFEIEFEMSGAFIAELVVS